MTNLLVTGSDSSLGGVLVENGWQYNVIGMPSNIIWQGKTAIDKFIKSIEGKVDIVINNYGINHLSWIGTTPELDAEIFNVNTMAPYWVINALVVRGDICRVVNVASATYRVPQRCTTLYCASKAALVMMTKVMARELAPQGWVINAIAPGLIEDTKMSKETNAQVLQLRQWTPEESEKYGKNLIPMKRYTDTSEVAEAIFMMLNLPDYINGTVVDMMGGV